MKITIIGTGLYGLGIGMALSKKNNNIVMWSENKELVEEFNKTHKLDRIIKDIKIPDSIKLTNSYEEALKDANIIFLIPRAEYIYEVTENIKKYYKKDVPVCVASKGIDDKTLATLPWVVKKILKTRNICAISGPTFAIDLMNNEPTALAIAGFNNRSVNIVKNVLENDTLKLRKSRDIYGIEICGSVKNIIAIAAGILDGLGYSESTRAFLINESLHDIKKLIKELGGRWKSILSFAGVGDLLLTCSSKKSRNYSFGYIIGSTKDKDKIKEYLDNNTVEGYYSLNTVNKMINKRGINIPLIHLMYEIVCNNKNPEELPKFLITKD